MAIDMSQFYQAFFEEAEEHLAEMETLLLDLNPANPSDEALNAIFRAAHSIKGSSGTFGFNDLVEVTHLLETPLDRLRNHEMGLGADTVDVFLSACDLLQDLLAAHRGGAPVAPEALAALLVRLRGVSSGVAPQVALARPTVEPSSTVETPLAPGPGHGGEMASSGDLSIRVGVEKVDQLVNLLSELVITHSMLVTAAEALPAPLPERLLNGLAQLERNSRDLQDAVLSIRMLPIASVFSRFPRMVRELAGKLGKRVELTMRGEHTELDKGLIEKIADPLTHLIRNSLDHGIETPEKRLASGKPAWGTITLTAAHQGGNIVIEVADDGAGLNRQKILAKAREQGLDVSDSMGDQDVWSLIFAPGFSTADQVSDLSGRGVGMDVVRQNIQALGGSVAIESTAGLGTRMTVILPLTLAILDGMSVAVGEEIYIFPLGTVVESLQPLPAEVKTVASQGRLIQVRGDYVPVVTLHEVFDVRAAVPEFHQGILVILQGEGGKAAVFVDALIGQHQVVIKSLERHYRQVPGVSGATILGDGRVAFIVDVSALIAMAKGLPVCGLLPPG